MTLGRYILQLHGKK